MYAHFIVHILRLCAARPWDAQKYGTFRHASTPSDEDDVICASDGDGSTQATGMVWPVLQLQIGLVWALTSRCLHVHRGLRRLSPRSEKNVLSPNLGREQNIQKFLFPSVRVKRKAFRCPRFNQRQDTRRRRAKGRWDRRLQRTDATLSRSDSAWMGRA